MPSLAGFLSESVYYVLRVFGAGIISSLPLSLSLSRLLDFEPSCPKDERAVFHPRPSADVLPFRLLYAVLPVV